MFFEGEPSKITFVGGIGGAGEVNLAGFFGVLTLSREPSIPGSAFFTNVKSKQMELKWKLSVVAKNRQESFKICFFNPFPELQVEKIRASNYMYDQLKS